MNFLMRYLMKREKMKRSTALKPLYSAKFFVAYPTSLKASSFTKVSADRSKDSIQHSSPSFKKHGVFWRSRIKSAYLALRMLGLLTFSLVARHIEQRK